MTESRGVRSLPEVVCHGLRMGVGAGGCTRVFIFYFINSCTIDRANGLANEKSSAFRGQKTQHMYVRVCVCLWSTRYGLASEMWFGRAFLSEVLYSTLETLEGKTVGGREHRVSGAGTRSSVAAYFFFHVLVLMD